MKVINLCFSIILFSLYHSCSIKDINYKVSKAISKKHNYNNLISDKNFKLSRKALINSGKLSFVNLSSDTLYILEMVDGESNVLLAKAFNTDKSVEYKFHNKAISFDDHQYFSGKIETLVEKGNTLEIMKQESLSETIHPKTIVYASRIIFKNKDLNILTYSFKYF